MFEYMKNNNAWLILKTRLDKNPKLKAIYYEEKRKYQIADQIREARKKAGLSQKELANKIHTTQSVISRLEMNDYRSYTPATLRKLARALDLSVADLTEREGETSFDALKSVPSTLTHFTGFRWASKQNLVSKFYAS